MTSHAAAATMIAASLVASAVEAQERRAFAGALIGVATLSADARAEIEAAGADVSLYKPENGPALNLFSGVHLHEYVALQANYVWNRNDLMVVAAHDTEAGPSFFERPFTSSQHAVVGEVLLYFRGRTSGVRPYLSAGLGVVRLETRARSLGRAVGLAPPEGTKGLQRVLRVAVGLDLAVGRAWRVRYSFSETVSGNPIAAGLSPPGERGLANFQNLIGLVRVL